MKGMSGEERKKSSLKFLLSIASISFNKKKKYKKKIQ
jgi:hypothetical protein